MMRLYFPILLVLLALGWAAYELIFKKNKKQAKGILSVTAFFSSIWGLIYWWLLS